MTDEVDSHTQVDSDEKRLTIQIPRNLKPSYVGKRGKLRCDFCRGSNLKCDRALPCSSCSWAPGRECKYTPITTPPFRGVVRCNSCRAKNMKCNRNVPFCNNCINEPNPQCHYTPKRSNKATGLGDRSSIIAPSTSSYTHHRSPEKPLLDSEYRKPGRSQSSTLLEVSAGRLPRTTTFVPLPETVVLQLGSVDFVEMPGRGAFDQAIESFIATLIPEFQETACLSPETYSAVFHSLGNDDVSKLSPHVRTWIHSHPLKMGSNTRSLLVLPRDFGLPSVKAINEELLAVYQKIVDNLPRSGPGSESVLNAFERIPVQHQIYDILVYAHREHTPPFMMLEQVRQLGYGTMTWPMAEIFFRLCPTCILRNSQAGNHDIDQPHLSGIAELHKWYRPSISPSPSPRSDSGKHSRDPVLPESHVKGTRPD
ncbi:hypothetical protein C8J56DRAFT_450255 [Mycena floridula]|nr:hypothetical protein C8J56DRAFT_450255 [Mycena floridula]